MMQATAASQGEATGACFDTGYRYRSGCRLQVHVRMQATGAV